MDSVDATSVNLLPQEVELSCSSHLSKDCTDWKEGKSLYLTFIDLIIITMTITMYIYFYLFQLKPFWPGRCCDVSVALAGSGNYSVPFSLDLFRSSVISLRDQVSFSTGGEGGEYKYSKVT